MTDLGRKVEPQVAVLRQGVLNKQGHLAGQAELDAVGQAAGLAEVDEVLQREGEGDGLAEVDGDVLAGLFDVGVLSQLDGAGADVTLAAELDTLLCALNRYCFGQPVSCPVLSFPTRLALMITYPTRTGRSGLCRCAGTRPRAW